jgi:hypothetical protein
MANIVSYYLHHFVVNAAKESKTGDSLNYNQV